MARRAREFAVVEPWNKFLIAGDFPPGLNTADPAYDLGPGESPDCYGVDMSKDGRLAKSTAIPTGTARIINTVGSTCTGWHYNRMWLISTNTLLYYAPYMQTQKLTQGVSVIPFDEDTNSIVAIVPFGGDSMLVAKSTGSYVLSNCSDIRAYFSRSDIIQELACASSARIAELDNVVYVSNTSGLVGLQGGKTVEFTRAVRNDVTNFDNLSLTVDMVKKRVIGTEATDATKGMVYDVESNKIFYWPNSSGFRWTSRQFHLPDWSPFKAERLCMVVEHGDETNGWIKYQIRYEDGNWENEQRQDVHFSQERYTNIMFDLAKSVSTRRFQIRINDISGAKYIKEIRLDSQSSDIDSYGQ